MFSNGFSMRPRRNRTWSTPWSTPPSSRSTATGKAQKGDSEPGHWQIQGRHDDQNPALTDALGNLVRFVLLPGQRYATVGIAPLINDVEFGGLIADKAFDSNWII